MDVKQEESKTTPPEGAAAASAAPDLASPTDPFAAMSGSLKESPKAGMPKRTPAQTKALNAAFEKSNTLTADACTALASSLSLPEQDVKDYFVRKRNREKKAAEKQAAEPKKRKGDVKAGGPAKKKANGGASPKPKKVKATAAQTAAAIKAIEAIHGPPRGAKPSESVNLAASEQENAALKQENAALKAELASAKSEIAALKAAATPTAAATADADTCS